MTIYLDFEFLENFLLSDDDSEVFFRLKSILKNPENKCNLVLNFDPVDYYGDPEKQIIVRHISQRLDAQIEIDFVKIEDDFSENQIPPSSFFLSDLLTFNLQAYGYLHVKSSNYNALEKILFVDNKPINDNQKNWDFLSIYKVPCNSMIISDNYLFSNDTNFENIKSILKNILPKELKTTFDLIFIGYDPKKHFVPIEKIKKDLLDYLNSNYTYAFNLSIIREDSHERAIYTNLAKYSTHKGFSIFKNTRINKKDEQTLVYTPIGAKNLSVSAIESYNTEIAKINKITKVQRMPDREIGSKQNRLFENKKASSITP